MDRLIGIAKDSISSYFSGKQIRIEDESEPRGVFVTLTLDGQLRGCIGFPEPQYPLEEAVSKAALSAAFGDPRFHPLTHEEFKRVQVEISVLSVPKKYTGDKSELPDKIRIGSDGLIIRSPRGSGLLLPQVAVEWGWDSKEFLSAVCEKAGLPPDSWKTEDIYTFQAEIIHDKS